MRRERASHTRNSTIARVIRLRKTVDMKPDLCKESPV